MDFTVDTRRKTRQINVGGVKVGGGAPVSIQSMLDCDTTDVEACVCKIDELKRAGCHIIRLAVPDMPSVEGFARVRERSALPMVADIHFDYRLALESVAAGADKIRINPGNIGGEENVKAVAIACAQKGIPIRVGANTGSVSAAILNKHGGPTPRALCESALEHARLLEKYDFADICVAVKSSSVRGTIEAYRIIAETSDYPLHLGVTEAGTEYMGTVKSAIGIGSLLAAGIGDTIRVSLTSDPLNEVTAARAILSALDMGEGVRFVSCPTCARCKYDLVSIAREAEARCGNIEKTITVAIMGCAVNGPGEAREADIGIAGASPGEVVLFKKGRAVGRYPEKDAVEVLMNEIEKIQTETVN